MYNTASTTTLTMTLNSRYSWIDNLKAETFLANSRERVRVMGVLTAIDEIPLEDRPLVRPFTLMCGYSGDDYNEGPDTDDVTAFMKMITVEDGTGTMSIWTPKQMLDALGQNLELGQTFDCILKLRQNGSVKRWFTETMIRIDNAQEEQLRWIILSHQDQHYQAKQPLESARQGNNTASFSHAFGFPTRRRDASELYRLIRTHVQIQQKRHQMKANRTRLRLRPQQQRRMAGGKTTTGKGNGAQQQLSQPSAALEGILLDDLALVIQKPKGEVQEMIHGLQLEGRIYQNGKGEYLPL